MLQYLIPFLFSFCVALGLSLFFSFFSWKASRYRLGKRHFGKRNLSRLGGVAIIAAFFSGIAVNPDLVMTKPLWGLVVGGIFILVFGLIDDFFEIDWKTQMLFQFGSVILAYLFFVRIEYVTHPFSSGVISFPSDDFFFLSFIVTLLWFLLIMNSVNWLDGADGLLGGVGSIACCAVFFVSLLPEVHQPPVAILAALFCGSLMGFLILNAPPARIFAGTTGSMFVGFALAVLSVFAGSKIATTLLVLSIPILDAGLVVFRRLFSGDSIFLADRRHLHFRLLDAGWSMQSIFLMLSCFTIFVAIAAVFFSTPHKVGSFFFVAALFAGGFLFLERSVLHKKIEK